MARRTSDARCLNRELSWLDFNARVLALAERDDVPLLERAKFLAIFSQNLDEFFQVRVAGLKDQVAAGIVAPTPDGRTPAQQLLEVRDRVETAHRPAERIFLEQLRPRSPESGSRSARWAELDEEDVKALDEVFEERIFPVLTPLAVDPGHPFPYISHLSLNLAVLVRDPVTGAAPLRAGEGAAAACRASSCMPDGERFVPLEQVIAAHLDQLFPGMEVVDDYAFRVTRNADLTLEEEEADDLLAAVELELRRRRFRRAVRLELDADTSDEVRELLRRELDVDDDDIYLAAGPLDLGGLWAVHALDRPDLKDPAYTPVTPPALVADGRRARRRVQGARASATCSCTTPTTASPTTRRGVRPPGRRRPAGARHQAHALPHVRRQPDRPLPHPRRRAGQAGGGARRAQGARRRAGQRRVGPSARRSGRPRRLRARRAQDAHQDRARGARRARRHPPLRATSAPATTTRRPRSSTKTSGCSRPTPTSGPTSACCSTTSPATGATCSYQKLLVAPHSLRPAHDRARLGEARPTAATRARVVSGRRSTASSTPT